jgi:hypothetical protein
MNENDKAILKSLLTKLSAVRMTLNDEEQAVLDLLVQGSLVEVEAHRMERRVDEGRYPKADEVVAHRLEHRIDDAREPKADEVVAHRVDEGRYPKADEASRFVIYFDAELEAYQIKP